MFGWFCLNRHALVVTANETDKAYRAALGIDIEKGTTSFDDRIRKEYRLHTIQYWFVASLANGLLWMQIVIGAALTALGAIRTSESQTATIYLGAASTITAGLLTYFKSRNQPNRARQLRQALRAVRNRMDDQSRNLAGLTPEQSRDAAQKVIKQYDDALAEAAANYPDLWVSLGHLRKFLPGNDPNDGTCDDQLGTNQSGSGTKPNEHGTDLPSSLTLPPIQHGNLPGLYDTQVRPGDNSTQSNTTSSHTTSQTRALALAQQSDPEKSNRDTAAAATESIPQAPPPTEQISHTHTTGSV